MGEYPIRDKSIDLSTLPDISQPNRDFKASSFFRKDGHEAPRRLPSPEEVLERSGGGPSGVAKFESLDLAVKFDESYLFHLEEVQTMIAIRAIFQDSEICVPEIFGWRTFRHQTFIYMSLISGPTLRQAWPGLSMLDKEQICGQMKLLVRQLRRIRIPNHFIGNVNGGFMMDRYFRSSSRRGPLPSIKEFNDSVVLTAHRKEDFPLLVEDFYRPWLSDSGSVYFTHGDLTLDNIVIGGDPGKWYVKGVLDWEQSGWYPEYWEYCKMLYGVECDHEWHTEGWADKITRPFPKELEAVEEYSLWIFA